MQEGNVSGGKNKTPSQLEVKPLKLLGVQRIC